MQVDFYKSFENPLKVDKTPTATVVKNIATLGNMSLLTPSFIVDKDENVLSSNYCQIADFGRYYFIKNMSIMDGGRILVECEIDVLNSFKDDINNMLITVLRNGGIGAPTKITDNKLPVIPNEEILKQVAINDMYNSFDGTNGLYVLQCIGGNAD